jgi:hypothetical protein
LSDRAVPISCPASPNEDQEAENNMYQDNWTWCDKCQGLFFAGNNTLGVCPAGGAHNTAGSGDYTLATSGGGQSDWAWCDKCQGLFFAGNNTLGVCPAGDAHDGSYSSDYVLAQLGSNSNFILADECNPILGLTVAIYVTQDIICESVSRPPTPPQDLPKGFAFQLNCYSPQSETSAWQQYCLILWGADQSDWRWCDKCQGLFFAGNNQGVCPAGGAHNDTGSSNYTLATSAPGQYDANCQPGWSWCDRCQGLFFAGNDTFGVCPAGGTHDDAGSNNYKLAMSGYGQPGWRWCDRCQGLFFADNTLGACPAGGAHNDTGSSNYTLATVANGEIQGMINNWPVSGGAIVDDIFHVATLPSQEVPAGYQLVIELVNDLTEDITGARFLVTDSSGNEIGNLEQKIVSDVDGTPGQVAPIAAFELNLVGPINLESAVLSSGAGTITYSAIPPLTALLQEPACTESGYITGETANSFYSVLPDSPADSLTQSFSVSSTRGMIRKQGKLRPSAYFPTVPG